jgi:tetratricopeptide (TPR) repeat protein
MNEDLRRHLDALTASHDHEGLMGLGEELFAAGEHSSAAEVIRAAHDAGSPVALPALATVLDTQGRTADAEAVYREAIASGDDLSLVHLADMLLYEDSRREEAEELVRRGVECGVPSAQYVLGKILGRQPGREDEAEAAFMAESDPTIRPSAQLELGRLLTRISGREADAERALRASGLPAAQASLASLIWGTPGREQEAIEAQRQAAEAGEPHAWNNLTVMLKELGQAGSAEAAYRDGIARGETALLAYYGDFLQLHDRRDDAEQVLRLGLSSDPKCAFVLGGMLIDDPERVDEGRELLIMAAGAGIVDAAIQLARRR